eukprot:gnl/Trimastix_PCT/799.p1 GENE.gnl/Trimastix_PCT/799~~gnl/Trimastix_PCT/799.p1  ORF type:complete len:453 (+),score=183.16 gnl/Trimastix_PCT/799:863-2221(+)
MRKLEIDTYLKATTEYTGDIDHLEDLWESAVRIAENHEHARIQEVVGNVAGRLVELKRFEVAGEIYQGVDSFKEAIDIYIQGQLWDKARSVAAQSAPHLRQYVEQAYVQALMQQDRADELVVSGNVGAGLAMMARRGEWDKVMEIAKREGGDTLAKYTLLYSDHLLKLNTSDGGLVPALRVFTQNGAPAHQAAFAYYKRLACMVLADGTMDMPSSALPDLREMLFRVVADLKAAPSAKEALHEFERLLLITHYVSLLALCRKAGDVENAALLATSLLRYSDQLKVDRAFYEAGVCNRDAEKISQAHVFFNRYLDLTEVIEDPDTGMLENSDFVKTDIPFDLSALPEHPCNPPEVMEEIRDWVVDVSMRQTESCTLQTMRCPKCRADIYEGTLVCPECSMHFEPCVVTGYPISPTHRTECASCHMPAAKHPWNQWIAQNKTCPWCGALQSTAR